jgi:DNA replication protein DnaC
LQDEINVRHQRILARRRKSADFREPRSLENFDFSFNPGINRAQIYELAGEARLLKKYLKPDLLVIDDMGLKILPAKSGEILPEIIMRRYENRSTMMTSNRPIEKWGKLLSDVAAAGAILDRLLHHAEIIPINGRSYRLQPNAKQPPSKK